MRLTHTLAAAAVGLLLLAGCESGEDATAEEVPDPADASDYADTYDEVNQHLLDNYGITESAELCDEYDAAAADLDYDPLIERIATESGVTYEDKKAGDDAVFDAIHDWCDPN